MCCFAFMDISVYLLKCADGHYYTGVTRRPIQERVSERNLGLVTGYTHSRRPVELVFVEMFVRIDEAIARERQIKGWSRRKKEALIAGDYLALPRLARGGRPRGSTGSP